MTLEDRTGMFIVVIYGVFSTNRDAILTECPAGKLETNSSQEYSVHDRLSANVGVLDDLNAGFRLSLQNRKYGQQFANLYYMRLEHLKPITKRLAEQAWSSMVVSGKIPRITTVTRLSANG
jgi:hypothetical protein